MLRGARLAGIRGPRWLRAAVIAFAATALWIALLRLPSVGERLSFDDGWRWALGLFFERRAQAGVDWIFTYGPLGFFLTRAYDADLFTARVIWELAIKAVFTLIAFGFMHRQRSAVARGVFFSTLLCLPRENEDATYALATLLLGVLLIHRGGSSSSRSTIGIIGAALLLSVLVLMKFTLFAFGTLVVVLVGIDLFWSGRCGTALAWAGAFGLGVVAVWMLIGQSPTNLPVYLLGAAEMVVGFADAMSLDGSSLEVGIAATVLFLLAATAISRSPWRSLQLSGVSSAALLFAGLGLFFKEGFVRHDQHACHFFAFALPATLIFPVALAGLDWRARWRRALLVLAGLLGAGGLIEVTRAYPNYLEAWPDPVGGIVEALPGLSDPAGLRRDLDARLEFLRSQQDLPRLRSVIGDDRVDVFGNFQAAVLLNRMNWHPRYGFQSYAAYTDRQSEQNAAFFDGPDAPLYVLANAWVIDGRFPPVEDGPALIRILAGYRPIAAERGFLLLRRTEGDARGARGALGTDRFVLRPKEVQDLPSTDRPLVLRLRARKSAWGALRSVLLRPPPLLLTVQASDGALLTHRVVPSLGGSGFLLSPLLREITDWVELYAVDGAPRRVLRLRLDAPSCESCYASFELEVDVLPALTSSRIDADQAASLRAQLRDP